MKERVYQVVIGALVVVVGLSSYNVYTMNDTKEDKKVVSSTVDISSMKPKQESIDVHALYVKEKIDHRAKNMQLDSMLSDYKKSVEKTKNLMKESNYADADNIDKQSYTYEPTQEKMSLSQIQERIQELESKYTSPSTSTETISNNDTPEVSTTSNTSNTIEGGNYASSSSSVPASADTQASTTVVSTFNESVPTSTQEVENAKILAYKDSISEITKMIEQINVNLN